MNLELGFSFTILNDSYAAGLGGLCVGGLFLLPFALKYGRRPVYVLSLAIEGGIAIWTAQMHDVTDLMLVNIGSCLFGALCEVMVQMTVADIYFVHQRGRMNAIYVWVLQIGSSLAPLAAGYITVSQDWRWVWWWSAILLGASFIVFIFFYEETMSACTIRGISNRSSDREEITKMDQSQDPALYEIGSIDGPDDHLTEITIDPSIPVKTYWKKLSLWTSSPTSFTFLFRHCYQPFLVLANIPAVLYISLLDGAMTAAVIIPITVYSSHMTLPPYNFTAEQIGLLGLPLFVGTLLGALVSGPLSDWMILRIARKNSGIYEPEMRLWLALAFTPFLAAGLLMFGIGVDKGIPWPFICVSLGLISFGSTPPTSLALTYITDAYTEVCIVSPWIGVE